MSKIRLFFAKRKYHTAWHVGHIKASIANHYYITRFILLELFFMLLTEIWFIWTSSGQSLSLVISSLNNMSFWLTFRNINIIVVGSIAVLFFLATVYYRVRDHRGTFRNQINISYREHLHHRYKWRY